VRLARWDRDSGDTFRDRHGFALPCEAGELGLLMAREREGLPSEGAVHDVFAKGDTWVPSTSLFRRDTDGDYWLEGTVDDLVHTAAGAVLAPTVAAVFEELPDVASSVAYALPGRSGDDLLVVAVELRSPVTPAAFTAAARRLPDPPALIHVVDKMPTSSVGRPLASVVRAAGIDLGLPSYRYVSGEYRGLTRSALDKLVRP
jgi:putative long chain acyl-CoA synthase